MKIRQIKVDIPPNLVGETEGEKKGDEAKQKAETPAKEESQ